MPSLILVLCHMPWAHKDMLGYTDSTKVKHGANHVIIQAVLLYGSESWALTESMECRLQSFHSRCASYITGQHIRQNSDET
jgi:hypothetical protein